MTTTIKRLGHASFRLNAHGRIIYTDPYEGDYTEEADLILVSNSHLDHCDPSKITEISKTDTVTITPEGCGSKTNGRITALKPPEETTVDKITIRAVEAYKHRRFRSPRVPFHPKGLEVGYSTKTGGKAIYHAGDTDFHLYNGQRRGCEAVIAVGSETVIPMHR